MTKAQRAGNSPVGVNVLEGKSYFWCSCGKSLKQPFCDGSHKKEGKFKSVKFTATETKEVFSSNPLKVHAA